MEKEKHTKTVRKIVISILLVITVILYFYSKTSTRNTLTINEIAFSQSDSVDWIEIYNPTMNNLSLEDYYLTDDADNFSKFKIDEEIIVPANGFTVIYGEDAEELVSNATVANFRIKAGETVYLISRNGQTIVDSITIVVDTSTSSVTEADVEDATIGRYPDGGVDLYLMEATLGGENVLAE